MARPATTARWMRRAAALCLLLLAGACTASGGGGAAGTTSTATGGSATTAGALPALPLRTQGRWIVDASGKRFKLASVSWYGAESPDAVVAGLDRQPLATIAREVRALGFNSVRLPWSNDLVERNPAVDPARLAANPALQGLRALEVLDAVVDALAAEGVLVVLDDHLTRPDWCCSETDGNGLWYTATCPEAQWIDDWRAMVARYAAQPAVVACDLRNELRAAGGVEPTWGGGDPLTDWHAAAERCGEAILALNPSLLIVVEGLAYATDLTGVASLPVRLSVPGRLVYEAHDYSWEHPFFQAAPTYAVFRAEVVARWGFILDAAEPAPVWVGELGTGHRPDEVSGPSYQAEWFTSLRRYLGETDADWSYWPLDGTHPTGTGYTLGEEENYGVLDLTWSGSSCQALTDALAALEPATQGP